VGVNIADDPRAIQFRMKTSYRNLP